MFYIDPLLIFSLSLLHCLIGLCAAIVADTKHHSFSLWLLIGTVGGTIGLIASWRLKPKYS